MVANMITEVKTFLATGTVASYVALGIYAVVLLFALICALKGYLRGVLRMTVRILLVGASAFGAFLISKKIYPFLASQMEGKTVGDAVSMVAGGASLDSLVGADAANAVNSVDPETARNLIALPLVLIVIPLIFVALFLIFMLITKILYALLCNLLGFSKNPNVIYRVIGLVFGAVEGIAVSAVLLIPAVGFLNFGATASLELPPEAPIATAYETYMKPAAESTLVSAINRFGGEYIYSGLCTVEVEGESCDLRDPGTALVGIYADVTEMNGADWTALTPENEGTLKRMVARAGDDTYLASTVSGILRAVGSYMDSHSEILPFEEPTKSFVVECIGVLKTSDKTTFKSDLNTLLDVYFVLSDSGALPYLQSDSEKATAKLTEKNAEGKTPVQCAVDLINSNPRTAAIMTSLAKLSLSFISDAAGGEVATIYEDTKQQITDEVLSISREGKTEEEYVEAVSTALGTVLSDNGIELNEQTLNGMAAYIAEGDFDPANVTDEDICSIILNYFDSFVEAGE